MMHIVRLVSLKYSTAQRMACLSLLALVALAPAARAATCSTAFCTLDMNSRIWINNNTWGQDASPAGWSESITTNSSNSFRIDFNWPTGPNNNSVKAYPSAVLGWHWGWHFPSGTGLPMQLSANRDSIRATATGQLWVRRHRQRRL